MVFVIYFLLTSFFIGSENVLYFSVLSLRQLNSPFNSFASSFMTKVIIAVWLWKTTEISFGILYLKLHMLCGAPLYLPEQ